MGRRYNTSICAKRGSAANCRKFTLLQYTQKLLRVLQEGEFTTVGGRTALRANARIVAATHRDLRSLVKEGIFREDLYYRLNVVPVRLPPLRERLEDIPELVRHFLDQTNAEGLPEKVLDQAAA